MQRQPVSSEIKLEKRPKPLIRVLGVDPGFATMGLTILEMEQGSRPRAILTRVATTEKRAGKKKALVDTRVTVDDQRRLSDLWEALNSVIEECVQKVGEPPFLVGVEAYRPFSGRGGGNAWKSAVGYGLVSGFARARGWPLMVWLPDDLKRAFTLSRSSSKQEVETAMCLKVDGLRGLLDELPKGEREHAADAAGHAYLTIVEHTKMLSQFTTMLRTGAIAP